MLWQTLQYSLVCSTSPRDQPSWTNIWGLVQVLIHIIQSLRPSIWQCCECEGWKNKKITECYHKILDTCGVYFIQLRECFVLTVQSEFSTNPRFELVLIRVTKYSYQFTIYMSIKIGLNLTKQRIQLTLADHLYACIIWECNDVLSIVGSAINSPRLPRLSGNTTFDTLLVVLSSSLVNNPKQHFQSVISIWVTTENQMLKLLTSYTQWAFDVATWQSLLVWLQMCLLDSSMWPRHNLMIDKGTDPLVERCRSRCIEISYGAESELRSVPTLPIISNEDCTASVSAPAPAPVHVSTTWDSSTMTASVRMLMANAISA